MAHETEGQGLHLAPDVSEEGVMNISWIKPVRLISFSRMLTVVLLVAVCTVDAEDVETLRRKAEAGDAKAQYNLGWMCAKGWGVPKDDAEAAKWYHKAAVAGDVDSQFNLAVIYAKGKGVPPDEAEAIKW